MISSDVFSKRVHLGMYQTTGVHRAGTGLGLDLDAHVNIHLILEIEMKRNKRPFDV
jgi:hypothetical protein